MSWGLVTTALAPAEDILRYAAYHLDAGAHRVHIYLDDENEAAYSALKAHPKCRVTTCDAAWWAKMAAKRPKKHQVRQSVNATHTYRRKADVDWLIHMDVDEFLVTEGRIDHILDQQNTDVVRVRPMEALSGETAAFKGFIPSGPQRAKIVNDIYPTFGRHLKGGFLSHLAGKVFVRTGLPKTRLQIHNAFRNDAEIKGVDLPQDILALAHCHAKTWKAWRASYRFRLKQGSYRAGLGPNKSRDKGGLSLNELFAQMEQHGGEARLRVFFEEVCADSDALRGRLDAHGLLRHADLNTDAALSRHFGQFTR